MQLINDFFKPTQEEIEAIENDGKLIPEHGKRYKFTIVSIKEKDKIADSGESYKLMIINLNEVNKKLEYTMFVKSNKKRDIANWVKLVCALVGKENLINGIRPTDLIGKMFEATAEVNEYNGKKYSNLKAFSKVSDVPTIEVDSSDEIPF